MKHRFNPAGVVGNQDSSVRRLRKLDIYRKVPKDLTEGSVVGGLVTAVSILALLLLTLAELRALLQINQETEVVLDTSEDGSFRINLNLTVSGLSCEFLHVTLKNALGLNREVNDDTLHKYATDKEGTWVGSATRKLQPVLNHTYLEIPKGAKDHYGNERHAIELDAKDFQEALNDYEVLLVDFHSPRCIHCVKFAPIFERAAQLVKDASPGKGVIKDSHKKYSVALATVDCLQNFELCRAQHIQAYPTVLVFRENKNAQESNGQYEAYHGPREPEPIRDFALKVLNDVLTKDATLGQSAFAVGPTGIDATGDGTSDSTRHTAGCRVEGYLDVKRVPGSVIIYPHSKDNGHEFDTGLVNVDHRIQHLSFGLRRVKESIYDDDDSEVDGAYAKDFGRPLALKPGKEQEGFRGREPGFSHVHFVKVVSRTYVPLGRQAIQNYEYSINSDNFKPHDLIPSIEFAFDLSPLQIRVKETRKNWIEGFVSVLALVGGVFSASYIVESILSSLTTYMIKQD